MPGSSPYTYQPLKTKKAGVVATWLISIGAIGAGIVFGILPNGGFPALFPTTVPTATPLPTGSTAVTKTGDSIKYLYGTVQLSVTRDKGKLTAVDLVLATASDGRDKSFPGLQQAAVAANGSNFGNVGGATYTSKAFKLALDSAIAKLP